MGKAKKTGFYAVAFGHCPGVYESWPDAEKQVAGYAGAKHKKFATREQALAFISANNGSISRPAHLESTPPKRPVRAHPYTRPNALQAANTQTQTKAPLPSASTSRNATIEVWCDGSARGNGKIGSQAGSGVFWGTGNESRNIAERLPGKVQTNNRAELYAIIRALEEDAEPTRPLCIWTDSSYSERCLCEWFINWERKGWKTSSKEDVVNLDLILFALLLIRQRQKPPTFKHVAGHSGDFGNERADQLANEGALKPEVADEFLALKCTTLDELKQVWTEGGNQTIIDALDIDPEDLLSPQEMTSLVA